MGLYRRPDSPFWWICIERPGERPVLLSTKIRHDAPTPEQRKDNRQLAEYLYHQKLTAQAKGQLGLAPKPAISFDAYADWFATHVIPSHGSRTRELSILKHLRAWFRVKPLHLIDKANCLEYRTYRLQHVAPATVDRELDVLKSLLASAVPKYLEASPIRGMKRHRETIQSKKRRPRVVTREEETRMLDKARTAEERALVILAVDTIMRLSDVTQLRRDRDNGDSIHVEAPKIDPYDVPLSTRARHALDALPVRGPFFFPRRWSGEGGISANTAWRIFKRLCEDAGVVVGRKARGVTFHSLRHTGTTRMLDEGVSPIDVMEIGGWSDLRQLARYGHGSREGKAHAVNLIGGPRRLRSVKTAKKRSRK